MQPCQAHLEQAWLWESPLFRATARQIFGICFCMSLNAAEQKQQHSSLTKGFGFDKFKVEEFETIHVRSQGYEVGYDFPVHLVLELASDLLVRSIVALMAFVISSKVHMLPYLSPVLVDVVGQGLEFGEHKTFSFQHVVVETMHMNLAQVQNGHS